MRSNRVAQSERKSLRSMTTTYMAQGRTILLRADDCYWSTIESGHTLPLAFRDEKKAYRELLKRVFIYYYMYEVYMLR